MKFYLLKMKVRGIKNIDKDIELNFYKQTLTKAITPQGYNVKAIYGANGAGKTALMYAAEIYRKINLNKDYLTLYNSNGSLNQIINQKSQELYLSMTFGLLTDNYEITHIYEHSFTIINNHNHFVIGEECLKELTGLRLNDTTKWHSVFKAKEGKLLDNKDSLLEDKTKNVLSDRLVTAQILNSLELADDNDPIIRKILDVCCFAEKISVVLNTEDKNYINFSYISQQLEKIKDYRNAMNPQVFMDLLIQESLINSDEIPVKVSQYPVFEESIQHLSRFIKVIKPDLNKITIKKEENGDHYMCQLLFVYNDGRAVSRQYESTGIKKLLHLYYALCRVEKGDIVFIDEFDANIHDVVLMKIIDYIKNYTQGQLIFTTHNCAPMDILQDNKYAIDFLSNDAHIVSWKKIGNCSASHVYRNGLIKYSPFNIESFSFLGVFDDGSNE